MSLDVDELYGLAFEADRQLFGPNQADWLDKLDQHREALHSLLDLLIESSDCERALKLSGALSQF